MENMYLINKKVLKQCKIKGYCVCNKTKTCPCEDFLEKDECLCRAYQKIK